MFNETPSIVPVSVPILLLPVGVPVVDLLPVRISCNGLSLLNSIKQLPG